MKTLKTIIQEKDQLAKERSELVKNYQRQLGEFDSKLRKLTQLEQMGTADLDVEKIQMAEKIIECTGNVDELVDGSILTDKAAIDIANGHPHLKSMYFGNKRYEGFYQRSDHQYGYGPKHGSIVDRISMANESRGQLLCEEEIEACIYYLKNYAKIKSFKSGI